MQATLVLNVALVLLVSGCSRTPQPQSTPSASAQPSLAPIASLPSRPGTSLSSTIASTSPDSAAVRSQEDCPERMVFIPKGRLEFTGPVPGDKDQSPRKQSFVVGPFCIDEFEAPDAYELRGLVLSWEAVEKSCGKRDRECRGSMRSGGPLACVTPAQAECYCDHILPGVPKRLPTDEEFLFAALGTDGRLFPWGNDLYPEGHQGASSDFCSFEPNVEPKAYICAPWMNKSDRSPFGVIGMATNGGEITVIPGPKNGYVIRGYSHESQNSERDSIGLSRWPSMLSDLGRGGPFLSFRCVVDKRKGG